MDETSWLAASDPLALLGVLFPQHTLGSGAAQSRTCRLYLTACARRHWDRLPPVCRALVAAAEHLAELGDAGEPLRAALIPSAEYLVRSGDPARNLQRARAELEKARAELPPDLAALVPAPVPGPDRVGRDWRGLTALAYLPFEEVVPPFAWAPREFHSAALVRDIYYHPNGLPPLAPEWRTFTVVSLARRMYDEREFRAMPILADALQDAGCDSDAILAHCRDPHQEHARGCWVLDRVLDRR